MCAKVASREHIDLCGEQSSQFLLLRAASPLPCRQERRDRRHQPLPGLRAVPRFALERQFALVVGQPAEIPNEPQLPGERTRPTRVEAIAAGGQLDVKAAALEPSEACREFRQERRPAQTLA